VEIKHMHDFRTQFDKFTLTTRVTVGVPSCQLSLFLNQDSSRCTEAALDPAGAAEIATLLQTIADDQLASPSKYAKTLVMGAVAPREGCEYGVRVEPIYGVYRVSFSAQGRTYVSEALGTDKLKELASFFADLGQALAGEGAHHPDADPDEHPVPGHRSRVSPLGSS
jgi:hypothetical protein